MDIGRGVRVREGLSHVKVVVEQQREVSRQQLLSRAQLLRAQLLRRVDRGRPREGRGLQRPRRISGLEAERVHATRARRARRHRPSQRLRRWPRRRALRRHGGIRRWRQRRRAAPLSGLRREVHMCMRPGRVSQWRLKALPLAALPPVRQRWLQKRVHSGVAHRRWQRWVSRERWLARQRWVPG